MNDWLDEILDEQFKRLDGTIVLPIYNRPTAVGQAKQAIQDYISKNYFTKEQILEFINGLEVQPHPDDQKYTDEIMRVMKIHARTKLEAEL